MLRDGLIRRFFWIRYNLGGPHVRLRLEVEPAHARAAAARVHADAEAFFRRAPSTATQPDDVVRRRNRGIVPSDRFAAGQEDVVFADHSVAELPVQLEVDRYGGAAVLEHSLGFFALSSAVALGFVAAHRHLPAAERLAGAVRMLVRQARGYADDGAELVRLLGYALPPAGRQSPYVAAADAAFATQGDALRRVLRSELDSDPLPELALGARDLSSALRGCARREAIGASHLHMTANRLGLTNREEIYLSRLMVLAAED
jgi:hypothetical protein